MSSCISLSRPSEMKLSPTENREKILGEKVKLARRIREKIKFNQLYHDFFFKLRFDALPFFAYYYKSKGPQLCPSETFFSHLSFC